MHTHLHIIFNHPNKISSREVVELYGQTNGGQAESRMSPIYLTNYVYVGYINIELYKRMI